MRRVHVQEGERRKAKCRRWFRKQGLDEAATVLDRDWEPMFTFYRFPKRHWLYMRRSHPSESLFATWLLRVEARTPRSC